MSIKIPLNMKMPNAEDAKKLFVNTVEKINQKGFKITNVQIEKFQYLARLFSESKINLDKLKNALSHVYDEAINLAG